MIKGSSENGSIKYPELYSVPGRQISQNLRYIRDVIFFCDVNKINGYILSMDQEKAFDMMDKLCDQDISQNEFRRKIHTVD